ncbi:UNVERIFIED_CONTAM: hypothetical protein Slati_3405700 [Sesamum latifolium]|uniref:Uncharacterized protein n=1 Tax=Sesamum latifolium TaxID=2727402 RepID=A0AAW2UF09_9LAMI
MLDDMTWKRCYIIVKSLSRQDIQTIVEKGCPSLFRKAVNSAKRLRAYLGLDEGDVCSSCDLRGSCDRAYIMLNDSEAAARTVDVVRILLLYALDPLVISGENKLPGKVLLESSARKLLSELIELGDTPPDPDLPKPVAVTSQRRKQSVDLLDNKTSKNVDMKPGLGVCQVRKKQSVVIFFCPFLKLLWSNYFFFTYSSISV